MPLTTTITEDRTIKREQLAFDVAGGATYSSGIGGGGVSGGAQGPIGPQGSQGVQGVQGSIGAQGFQGVQGVQGAIGAQGPQGEGLAFAAGSQGRVVFVGSSLSATTNEDFTYDTTNGSLSVRTTPSYNGYAVSITNGAQGINASAVNVLEIKADDDFTAASTANHGIVTDYNSRRGDAAPATLGKTIVGFDGVTNQRTQVAFYVYDFQTSKTSHYFIHTKFDRRLVYHTGNSGYATISTTEVLTNNVSTGPLNGFGAKVVYALQIGTSATTYEAVAHEYSWRDTTSPQSQYNIQTVDYSLNNSTPDFESQQITSRNTRVIGWTTTTNQVTNALNVSSDMATASTPAANSGTSITLTAKSNTTSNRELGAVEGYWSTATDASRIGTLRLRATDSSSSTGFEIVKDNAGVGSGRTGVRLSPYDSVTGNNTSFVITPRGTGSLIAGTSPVGATGRGASTIDLSFERVSTTDVAAGAYTTIVGGKQNRTLSGSTYSGIFAGSNNEIKANVTGGAIIGSDSSLNQNQFSVVVGGASNSANSDYSVVVGGNFNATGAANSVAMGKYASAYIPNTLTIAAGEYTSAARDFQSHQFVLWTTMNSAAWFDLLNDGSAISQFDNSTWMIEALVSGRSSTGLAFAYRVAQAHERNSGTSGQLLGTLVKDIFEETGAGGYDVRFQSVNGQPKLQVLGIAGVFTKVSAFVKVSETRY